MQRVKQGDTVEVIAGKDKGERGEVMRVFLKENRVLINGVNMAIKHEKARPGPSGQQIQGQIVSREAPLHLSNVMPVCPSCDQRTRIGYRIREEDGYKTRVCKKCDSDLD
jgi:large subunit ribosomal protein L24